MDETATCGDSAVTIDDRIANASASAAKLEEACLLVADAHGGAADDPVVRCALGAAGAAKDAMEALRRCRTALAERRRPKGPMVTLEMFDFRGRLQHRCQVEVVSRTDATVLVRQEHGVLDRYKLLGGRAHGKRSKSRIAEADLERIRAMPVGENEVSKALRALEAKR